MKKKCDYSLTKYFFIYFIFIFISLTAVQKTNNALPFFYKDYPTYQVNGKTNFDSTSESLVLNRIDFSTLSLEYKYKFNLWRSNQEIRSFGDYRNNIKFDKDYITNKEYLIDGQPYKSQVGAQSVFWAKLTSFVSGAHGDYSIVRLISIMLISLCAAIIILWMRVNYGGIPAMVSLAFFVLSTGINIFSESLYWSIWLFIAPLSIVCFLELNKFRNYLIIFLFTFPVFLFKFLSGYEFITIIVFAAMTPYAWDFFINKNSSSFLRATVVGFSSVIAFLTSILIYDKLFFFDFNSSGVDNIFLRSGSWSFRNLNGLDINALLQFKKILIMNFFDINGYGIPFGFFIVLIIGMLTYFKSVIQFSHLQFITFLFLGSVSWLIAQPGHVLFHPRYAILMFFIPFGLFIPGFLFALIYKKKV